MTHHGSRETSYDCARGPGDYAAGDCASHGTGGLFARTIEIADACRFSLGDLKYEYPDEPVPPGKTAQQHLEDLTWQGAAWRYPKTKYPNGIPEEIEQRSATGSR